MRNNRFLAGAGIGVLTLQLLACGGGSGGGGTQARMSVADAPVDGATSVVVVFTGVQLIPGSGNPVEIDFATPKSIDLIKDSGTASAVLFDQPIPSGAYEQIRLLVLADGNPSNSRIVMSDGSTEGLNVPSGSQTGLKLVSGFTVPASGVVDYTIDFDLRKAITCPPGQGNVCLLKPAERLVDNTRVGNIQGVVSAALVTQGCTPGVYLYAGTVAAPEDADSGAAATDPNQPIASKVPVVNQGSGGGYYYQFTFLEPGTYTIAYTCQAAQDNPDQADPAVTFAPVKGGIAVAAGATATVDLP